MQVGLSQSDGQPVFFLEQPQGQFLLMPHQTEVTGGPCWMKLEAKETLGGWEASPAGAVIDRGS